MTGTITLYKGKQAIDVATFYVPYIPLTFEVLQPKITQDGLSFEFSADYFHRAFTWLQNDCRWKYNLHDYPDSIIRRVRITFEQPAGAIEFKLRWIG